MIFVVQRFSPRVMFFSMRTHPGLEISPRAKSPVRAKVRGNPGVGLRERLLGRRGR
jgi:hypothetical protein